MKSLNIRQYLVPLSLMILAVNACAQPEPRQRVSKEQVVARRLERIDAAVKLSKEQKSKIKTILEEEIIVIEKNMIARRKSGASQNFEKMKSEMDKIRESANSKIRAILTEKQQEAYTKFLAEEAKNRPGGKNRP